MSNEKVPTQKVYFSREQYEFLAKVYPENTASNQSDDELRTNLGRRQVIKFIQLNVK